LIKWKI